MTIQYEGPLRKLLKQFTKEQAASKRKSDWDWIINECTAAQRTFDQ